MSRIHTAALSAAVLALLAALGGCSNSSQAAPPVVTTTTSSATPSPTPVASPSATPPVTPEQAAVAQAEAVLRRYYATMNQLGIDPTADPGVLKELATGTGLVDAENQIGSQRQKGRRQIGELRLVSVTPRQVDLRFDPKLKPAPQIPVVQFDVCYDVSGVNVVDATGKSVVTADRRDRALAVPGIVNYNWPDPSGWKVGYETIKNEPCAGL